MYASIRRYQTSAGGSAELVKRVQAGFVPIIRRAPGFIAYYVVDAGNDIVASISVFHDQAGAEASNQIAAGWVKDNLAPLVVGSPEITAGRVAVHTLA